MMNSNLLKSIPACWDPMRIIKRGDFIIHNDLSMHPFTAEEKTFICQQFRASKNGEDLLIPPSYYDRNGCPVLSPKEVSDRHQFSVFTLKGWLKRFDSGMILNDSKGGHPGNWDEAMVKKVQERVDLLEFSNEGANKPKEIEKIINEEHQQLLIKRGRSQDGNFLQLKKKSKDSSSLCPLKDVKLNFKTIETIKSKAYIRDRQAQILSEARLLACLDIRLTTKVACDWKAFAAHNSAEYKWNFDCTTVIVLGKDSNPMRCVVREPNQADKKVQAMGVNNELNILIKIPTLGSAAGEIARLVTVTAIPSMPHDVFFKAEVKGLTSSSSGGDRMGYIYFC